MHVEVNVVILRERIKIGEIHFEQVLWLKGTEGSHASILLAEYSKEVSNLLKY